jgi:hypothetical protein
MRHLCNLWKTFSLFVVCNQGDQTSLLKNRPKCSPTIFKCITLTASRPKMSATFVIFIKLPKIGKLSPNVRKFAQSGQRVCNHRT